MRFAKKSFPAKYKLKLIDQYDSHVLVKSICNLESIPSCVSTIGAIDFSLLGFTIGKYTSCSV